MAKRHHLEGRLFAWAALFLLAYASALTLSPRVRTLNPSAPLRWEHWLGVGGWLLAAALMVRARRRYLPRSDPALLALALLLTGWGLLTIWRLIPALGKRQTAWLVLVSVFFTLGSRQKKVVPGLFQHKQRWLLVGLLLTGLTLLLGRNPLGYGPKLWLPVGPFYIQPSEPLKLLLSIYFAAYLAALERRPLRSWPYLLPTFLVTLLAVGLLVAQRDLGTASLLVMLYIGAVYLSSRQWRIFLPGMALLLGLGLLGYAFSDLIRLRLSIWYNPWRDPQGSGYQLIQALISLANGGLLGRGPGLGSPQLTPIAYSDFIYPALAEESGLLGALGLLGLWALLVQRSFQVALRAPQARQRLLAGTLGLYLGGQALVIIGGTIRLLPLTGVTLPFMSYGGSSLFTAFAAILLLLHISQQAQDAPAPTTHSPYRVLNRALYLGLGALALTTSWWIIFRGPDLLKRSDNPRRAQNARLVPRGALLDRHNRPINITSGTAGGYERLYLYPQLMPVIGYTHPVYGETGLEAALDPWLRGARGWPAWQQAGQRLLYGLPLPGLDVQLTLDAALCRQTVNLFAGEAGAAILLDASNGDILVMVSQPSYHPQALDRLAQMPSHPIGYLLNRATQGEYPLPPHLWAPFHAAGLPAEARLQPVHFRLPLNTGNDQQTAPLMLALDVAALVNGGVRPAPRIAQAVYLPQGVQSLPPTGTSQRLPVARPQALQAYAQAGTSFWLHLAPQGKITWAIGGTLPNAPGPPLVAVIVLETDDPAQAQRLLLALLQAAHH